MQNRLRYTKLGSGQWRWVMAKKRIPNGRTRRYYAIRQRTTKHGRRGQIIGLYRQPDGRAPIVRFMEDNL